jgi:hypothetical protein
MTSSSDQFVLIAVARLVLELHDVDLRALARSDDLSLDVDLGERVGVGGDRGAVDDEHDRQRDAVAGLRTELVDLYDVADCDLLLAAATAHDRVHRGLTLLVGT